MSVTIKDVRFENPVIGSSGTFGFGTEYASVFDVNRLGGIASKGLTLEPRQGNSGIRVWETPSGLMNSIGLQNPGIPHFIEYELPEMLRLKPVTIANLSGSTLETYVEGAKLLEKTAVPLLDRCSAAYECRVIYETEMHEAHLDPEIVKRFYREGDYHTLYFGEILACHQF